MLPTVRVLTVHQRMVQTQMAPLRTETRLQAKQTINNLAAETQALLVRRTP